MADPNPTSDQPRFQALCEIAPKPMRWLWPGWIGRGVLTMLDGEADVGKSTLASDLAARVSRGFVAPGSTAPGAEPAAALLVAAEDHPARLLRPRLEAAGAQLPRVFFQGDPTRGSGDIGPLRTLVQQRGVALVIVDPLQDFLNADIPWHNDQQVRRALRPLLELAEQTQAAVVLVRRPTAQRKAAALCCWTSLVVGREPGEPERRVLAMSRYKGGARPASLRFRLQPREEAVAIQWDGECTWTADEAMARLSETKAEALSRVEDCVHYIRLLLHERMMPSTDFVKVCQGHGFSNATILRARKVLGVKAVRTSLCSWKVGLPGQVPKCVSENLESVESLESLLGNPDGRQ
jgi:putative DNA primase/helicase